MLKFKKVKMRDAVCWVSSIYKIIEYKMLSNVTYYAPYYFREGGSNWDVRISGVGQLKGKRKMTLEEAMQACTSHANSRPCPEIKHEMAAERILHRLASD